MGYTANTGLQKQQTKYHCMVSGEKRLTPCVGCSNPTGCVNKTMQYKESTKMANTPTVQLLADGSIKCAKGLDLSECGYKPGAKTCGKCGAPAVAVKSDEVEVTGEWVTEWVTVEDDVDEKGMNPKKMKPVEPMEVMADDEEDDTDEYDEEKEAAEDMMPKKMKPASEMEVDAEEEMVSADEDTEKMMYEEDMMSRRKKARAKRMETMGVKSLDYDDNAFVCAIERKVYGGGSEICANCPGGCEPHADMPSLLEVEGIAEDMFSGKVLDSGYADESDIFVVDVQRKDGKPIEAYFDGQSGECMGWHLLDENLLGEVATIPGEKVISFNEAASIAVKSIEGDVVSVDADMFEGYDAYAVEIEGIDGKSYDVFVGIDGEVLGYDEYDAEEAADIDAEVADLALKRMYTEEQRTSMADEGTAMADGSYPIADVEDLKNAIMAYGRAKDKEATKKHIIKRAQKLGQEDLIPEGWMEDEPASEEKTLLDDETKSFLSSLMEFEMLTIEEGVTPTEEGTK